MSLSVHSHPRARCPCGGMSPTKIQVKVRAMTTRTLECAAQGEFAEDFRNPTDEQVAEMLALTEAAQAEQQRRLGAAAPFDWSSVPMERLLCFEPSIEQRSAHGPGVYWAEFSHDGSLVATCGHDKRVALRNSIDSSIVATLKGHNRFVMQCKFSPDDKYLISCAATELIVWSIERLALAQFCPQRHNGLINGVDWTRWPGPEHVVSAGNDGFVRLWVVKPSLAQMLPAKPSQEYDCGCRVIRAAAHPAMPLVLAGCADGVIRLFDSATRELVRRFEGHQDQVLGVAWAHGANTDVFGSCGHDGMVITWHMDRQRPMEVLDGHDKSPVYTVAFGPEVDQKEMPEGRLFTGGADARVVLWNLDTGKRIKVIGTKHRSWITCVAVCSNGRQMVTTSMHEPTSILMWSAQPPLPTVGMVVNTVQKQLEPVMWVFTAVQNCLLCVCRPCISVGAFGVNYAVATAAEMQKWADAEQRQQAWALAQGRKAWKQREREEARRESKSVWVPFKRKRKKETKWAVVRGARAAIGLHARIGRQHNDQEGAPEPTTQALAPGQEEAEEKEPEPAGWTSSCERRTLAEAQRLSGSRRRGGVEPTDHEAPARCIQDDRRGPKREEPYSRAISTCKNRKITTGVFS